MLRQAFKLKEKEITHHPLQNCIKDKYLEYLKCYHNSVYNPPFPHNQEKKKPVTSKQSKKLHQKSKDRFTIIGVMTHKDFVLCAHWVKALHKYKSKIYDAPVLNGVTDVAWAKRWQDLKIVYGSMAYCLQSPVAVLLNKTFMGGSHEFFTYVEKRFKYHPILDIPKLCVDEFANYVKASGRPCAYMHIAIENEIVGTFIFSLYVDIAPITCENFLRLCNEKRGGYSGTPIHRIVKDGWIQGGGYGLKSSNLDCENFMIPHDKRGLLCMANADRNVDCSTQFFILLQPAPWMDNRYVAFGQLVDGEATLKKIEAIPTYYESPKLMIRIAKAGILNLECQEINPQRGTNEFIQGHIEDLVALGEWIWKRVMEKLNFKLDLAEKLLDNALTSSQKLNVKSKTKNSMNTLLTNVHATQRFMRKKEDIHRQIERTHTQSNEHFTIQSSKSLVEDKNDESDDYDEDSYSYEAEEEARYEHISLTPSSNSRVKTVKPYYLPLTDVPYPGEVTTDFNLMKFMEGNYSLESDLEPYHPNQQLKVNKAMLPKILDEICSTEGSDESLNSEDVKEMGRFIKLHVDSASFSGDLIKRIAKENEIDISILENIKTKSATITDEGLRILRSTVRPSRIVYEPVSAEDKKQHTTKKRHTNLMRSNEHVNEKTRSIFSSIRKVRINESQPDNLSNARADPSIYSNDDDGTKELARQSVMARLYQDVTPEVGMDVPTLKDYKPLSEQHDDQMQLLTYSHVTLSENSTGGNKYFRTSADLPVDVEQMLNLQHGKKIVRKISSDYVKTIDRVQQQHDVSLRGIEYGKTRPSISVEEYQRRNRAYFDNKPSKTGSITVIKEPTDARKNLHRKQSETSEYIKLIAE